MPPQIQLEEIDSAATDSKSVQARALPLVTADLASVIRYLLDHEILIKKNGKIIPNTKANSL